MKIAIFNYGVGNIFSLKKAFEKISSKKVIVIKKLDKDSIEHLDILILPGVGHFSIASNNLSIYNDLIISGIENGLGLFCVCLGMQLLGNKSEEGEGGGLKIIKGETKKIAGDVKLPHMGWNNVKIIKFDELFEDIKDNSYFYFAHSYYFSPKENDLIIGETKYGVTFPSVIKTGLVVGVQFHPEKSGVVGYKLIGNYIRVVRR